ncbi:MAG: LuxR family transcriptional regulator, partial [Pseudomonadota bacterium]
MDTLKVLSEWNRSLAGVIGAIGTDDFFPKLIAAVQQRVPIAYPQVWLYHRELPPRVLYHEIPPEAVKTQVDSYLDG